VRIKQSQSGVEAALLNNEHLVLNRGKRLEGTGFGNKGKGASEKVSGGKAVGGGMSSRSTGAGGKPCVKKKEGITRSFPRRLNDPEHAEEQFRNRKVVAILSKGKR